MMPLFSVILFILCLGNCGVPLTLNFVGEFLSLYGTFERLPLLGALASSSIIFSAAYTIYMFNRFKTFIILFCKIDNLCKGEGLYMTYNMLYVYIKPTNLPPLTNFMQCDADAFLIFLLFFSSFYLRQIDEFYIVIR